jgi:hypothetical protein
MSDIDWSKLKCQCGKNAAIWVNPPKGAVMCKDCWNDLMDFKKLMNSQNPFEKAYPINYLKDKDEMRQSHEQY